MDAYRILLLDDEDYILAALRRELLNRPYVGHDGLEIEAFTSAAAALARAHDADGYFDVVISDNQMAEMSGIDFLRSFRTLQPDAVRILLTGHAEREAMVRAINEAHIDYFIGKPWNEFELKGKLFQSFRHAELASENRRLARLYLEFFGLQHPRPARERFRLLLVDDDASVLRAIERELGENCRDGCLGAHPLEVLAFEEGSQALAAAYEQEFDVVVCDYAMPGMNGIELLRLLRDARPDMARILLSGVADVQVLADAVNIGGVSHFVAKPWHDYDLRPAVDRALSQREMELENRDLADRLRSRLNR